MIAPECGITSALIVDPEFSSRVFNGKDADRKGRLEEIWLV